jgi:hypothetical protein
MTAWALLNTLLWRLLKGTIFNPLTVPKNIKGVKVVDGTNLLIINTNVFQRGTVWNTFRPFFGVFSGDLEQFGTVNLAVWNSREVPRASVVSHKIKQRRMLGTKSGENF